jgi:hypothetical protein
MKILQVPESRKMVEMYQAGYITAKELREQLEWYWDRKIYKGNKTPVRKMNGVPMTDISAHEE